MSVCRSCGAMLATDDPTPAEARVLEFVIEFHERRGRFPTYREIANGLRFRELASVRIPVYALGRKGWLMIERFKGIKGARRFPE